MPIYLTKVDISLDKFDAAASGKFNIGHIKFNEDGTITVASVHLYGGNGVFTSSDERAVNNATRASFKAAVIDMFGGEDKIPPAVKDAMKLADYGKGKPLTARRILAVKAAIDADGTARRSSWSRSRRPT